jgi:hypothetical protein
MKQRRHHLLFFVKVSKHGKQNQHGKKKDMTSGTFLLPLINQHKLQSLQPPMTKTKKHQQNEPNFSGKGSKKFLFFIHQNGVFQQHQLLCIRVKSKKHEL